MRTLRTLLISAAVSTAFLVASPASAVASMPDRLTTPVVVKTSEGPLLTITQAEVQEMRRANGELVSIQKEQAIVISQCVSTIRERPGRKRLWWDAILFLSQAFLVLQRLQRNVGLTRGKHLHWVRLVLRSME